MKKIISLALVLMFSFCSCAKEPQNSSSGMTSFESDITSSEQNTTSNEEIQQIASNVESKLQASSETNITNNNSKKQDSSKITSTKKQNDVVSEKNSSVVQNNSTKPVVSEIEPLKPSNNKNALAVSEYYGYKQLQKSGSAAEKKAYNLISQKVENLEFEIEFDFSITADEVDRAYNFYRLDFPQHFYRGNEHTITSVAGKVKKFTFTDVLDGGNKNSIRAKIEEFNSRTKVILSKVENQNNLIEVERIIHDELVNSVRYDETISKPYIYTAYGALVKKEAVCEGYASAFQYLMREVGVQCIMVKGTLDLDGRSESHAWNKIELGGSYYNVDVTSDDPIMYRGSNRVDVLRFNYFNLSDAEIKKTHTFAKTESSEPANPEANGTKYNFFNYYGLVIDNLTPEEFAKSIAFSEKCGYDDFYFKLSSISIDSAINYILSNTGKITSAANALIGRNAVNLTQLRYTDDTYFNICSIEIEIH
ncbi:MAG: hypothetical protein IJO86_02540 [Oscillospiraceae bacterium]|nr:hypothetical protein [Oscillospiraceae bacterium]